MLMRNFALDLQTRLDAAADGKLLLESLAFAEGRLRATTMRCQC